MTNLSISISNNITATEKQMSYKIIQGDNIDTLKQYPDNHFDSIVTDPPYGIAFLGKDWDNNTGAVETWEECLRVLKPGGYLLAFSAARTYHHLATNIEGVGFDIRDQLMWLYSSGFPKAQDVGKAIQRRQGVEETKPQDGVNAFKKDGGMSFGHDGKFGDKKAEVIPTSPEAKQWHGWNAALKPGHEPIVMARKPFKGSTIDNVLEHGTGALNIDACRIPHPIKDRFPSNVIGEVKDYQKYFYCPKVSRAERHCGFEQPPEYFIQRPRDENGNTIADTGPQILRKRDKANFDPLAHIPTTTGGMFDDHGTGKMYNINSGTKKGPLKHIKKPYEGDFEDKTRFSKGMEHYKGKNKVPTNREMIEEMGGVYDGNEQEVNLPHMSGSIKIHSIKKHYEDWCKANNKTVNVGNNHPTVKPVELMKYLIKLVTPPEGTVLDPFTGSGSTGMAAVELGYDFIGCELDSKYIDIANKRIEGWIKRNEPVNNYQDLFDEE